MAQCDDACAVDATLKAVEGTLGIDNFPANMNFDFVNQGKQNAWTFGFSGSKPVATNAFNLDKSQFAGSLLDNSTLEQQAAIGTPNGNVTKIREVRGICDTRIVNIEMITAGDQTARAIGTGIANNVVNIKTIQTGS